MTPPSSQKTTIFGVTKYNRENPEWSSKNLPERSKERLLLRQAIANGKGSRPSTVVNARFVEHAGQVVNYRALADDQNRCDLAIALALGDEA